VHEATWTSSGKFLRLQIGFDSKGKIARIAKLYAAAAESRTDISIISSHEVDQVIRREPTAIICENDCNPMWANLYYIAINRPAEEVNRHHIISHRLFAVFMFPLATALALLYRPWYR
jgi:hypothetical protein